MAIAHRATSNDAVTAAGTSANPAVPTGVQDGDLLLAWVSTALDVAITPPAGWNELGQFTGGGNGVWHGWKIASGESGTYAFTFSSSEATAIISAYSGVDTTRPIITWRPFNTNSGSSTPTVSALSDITTDPNTSMLVTFMSVGRGSSTATAPTGYNIPANGSPDSGGTTGAAVKSAVAYMAYTGGSGIAATNWSLTAGGAHSTSHLALRQSGDTQDIIAAWPSATTNGGAVSSFAVNMPLNHVSGDTLVCTVSWRGDNQVASMSGWTQKGSTLIATEVGANDNHQLATFYRIATSSSESGTVSFTGSAVGSSVAVTTLVKRVGTTGDPFADYQAAADSSSNTTSDVPALTVAAQDMMLIAAIERRGDSPPTAVPTGYVGWADTTVINNPQYFRAGSTSTSALIGLAVKYQTTADPAATSFTHAASQTSLGQHGAIGINTGAVTDSRRLFYATIIG